MLKLCMYLEFECVYYSCKTVQHRMPFTNCIIIIQEWDLHKELNI